jgi:hypothetical protein
MTPEQRMHFEITLSNNAIALQLEKEKIAKASAQAMIEGEKKGMEKGMEK